jgi:arsenate reductase-like glutaredoxin family protein
MEWDVFICHATEDKEEFVRPLANSLRLYGLKVWYDEFTLTVGDSLRRSIDKGLVNSCYGIVVISPSFFSKDWPQKELDGLAALEVNGRKVILPIWYQIDVTGVRKYSPTLADRVATKSQKGIKQVTMDIFEAMKRTPTKSEDISLLHNLPDEHYLRNVVSASEKKFRKVQNMMPELITEFKTDLSTEDNKLIREFFVLPNKKVLLGGSEKPRLVYYEEEHKGLRNKIDILENEGFLIDVTPGNTPIYRMTEEFVELIIKYG